MDTCGATRKSKFKSSLKEHTHNKGHTELPGENVWKQVLRCSQWHAQNTWEGKSPGAQFINSDAPKVKR